MWEILNIVMYLERGRLRKRPAHQLLGSRGSTEVSGPRRQRRVRLIHRRGHVVHTYKTFQWLLVFRNYRLVFEDLARKQVIAKTTHARLEIGPPLVYPSRVATARTILSPTSSIGLTSLDESGFEQVDSQREI